MPPYYEKPTRNNHLYKEGIQLKYGDVKGKQEKLFYINEPVDPGRSDDLTELLTIDSWTGAEMNKNEAVGYSMEKEVKRSCQGYVNDAGIEYQLQKLLYEAAGEDHLLQPEELKSYVKDNPLVWRPFASALRRRYRGLVHESAAQEAVAALAEAVTVAVAAIPAVAAVASVKLCY